MSSSKRPERYAKMTAAQRQAASQRRRRWRAERAKALGPVDERPHLVIEVRCRTTGRVWFLKTCKSQRDFWAAAIARARATAKPQRPATMSKAEYAQHRAAMLALDLRLPAVQRPAPSSHSLSAALWRHGWRAFAVRTVRRCGNQFDARVVAHALSQRSGRRTRYG